jgi:hypothetical protein
MSPEDARYTGEHVRVQSKEFRCYAVGPDSVFKRVVRKHPNGSEFFAAPDPRVKPTTRPAPESGQNQRLHRHGYRRRHAVKHTH